MAVFNVPNYLEKDGFGMSLNIRRGNPNPLDNSSVWTSFDEAQEYARVSKIAYVGQIITVVEKIDEVLTATAYVIDNEDGDLKEIGASTEDIPIIPLGDGNTIQVAEDGTISLSGINDLPDKDSEGNVITYQPRYENGKLTWVEVSSTTIEDVSLDINGLKSDVQDINDQIEDLNDKVDNIIIPEVPTDISAFNNDAGYQNASEVEALIANKIADINHAVFEKVESKPEVEDASDNVLYLVPTEDKKYEIYAKISNEMVLIDDTDVDLSGYVTTEDFELSLDDYAKTTDLDNYAKTTDLDDYAKTTDLDNYVLTSVLETLVTKEDIEEIISGTKTIEDLIETSKQAHTHENKSILDNITSDLIEKWNLGEENVISSVSSEFTLDNKSLALKLIGMEKVDGLSTKLSSIEDAIKNIKFETILDSISIKGTPLEIDENKNIDLPIASNTTLGLILGKGSDKENKISIEADGTLSINSLNVNKLVQDKNSYLVLNGGNASLVIEDTNE